MTKIMTITIKTILFASLLALVACPDTSGEVTEREYRDDGTLSWEHVYSVNGNRRTLKTSTSYHTDGITVYTHTIYAIVNGHRVDEDTQTVYREDGTKEEYTTYTYPAQESGYRTTEITYQEDGERKKTETVKYHSGVTKTESYITYQDDGETKDSESTYYPDTGTNKTYIKYSSNGEPQGTYPKCYDETNGTTEETCIPSVHGCTNPAKTCIL